MISIFARKSIDRLRRMLQAIRMGDLSIHFPDKNLRGAEKRLVNEMNEVITDFRADMLRKECQYGQYEAILNIVDAALIVADATGKINWMNKRAINDLCGFQITHLSMLDASHPGLSEALQSLHPGMPRIVTLKIGGTDTHMRLSLATYRHDGAQAHIYTVENTSLLVQQSEVEAQRKLVSVLTHEIMNSLSPIISLSATLCENTAQMDEDTALAIGAINRRSQGLLKFVENYRQLTRIAQPKAHWTRIGELSDSLRALFPAPYIHFEIEDPDIQLRIDGSQIEQVLINLIKNAVEACGDRPEVTVATKADHPQHQFIITVSDNGRGISPEAIDKIFVPFFTTKPDGSGIGLSLSRQIISMHGGIIKAESSERGTLFTIILPLIYRL